MTYNVGVYINGKKRKGDLNLIALRSETLSSSAVATNTMRLGP